MLHIAAQEGHGDLLELLVRDFGLDPEKTANVRRVDMDEVLLFELLLGFRYVSQNGESIFHRAIANKHLDIALDIIKKLGWDVNHADHVCGRAKCWSLLAYCSELVHSTGRR